MKAATETRLALIEDWLAGLFGNTGFQLTTASADASFRRYYRVEHAERTFIVMDAPPEREDCRPFVMIARALAGHDVRVPRIHATDLAKGLLLIEDFGDRHYLGVARADPEAVVALYDEAIAALLHLQQVQLGSLLPAYDRALLETEMALFEDWFLERLLGIAPTPAEREILRGAEACLVTTALEQPRVTVHRDYHSRNLMVLPTGGPGILDFQDALHGPLCYDLVSLLRDCYIRLPAEQIEAWLVGYRSKVIERGLMPGSVDMATLRRWFDWMGMQRHLKAIGIFARLKVRDGKPGYIADIPRTLGYVIDVAGRYETFTALREWLLEIQARMADMGLNGS